MILYIIKFLYFVCLSLYVAKYTKIWPLASGDQVIRVGKASITIENLFKMCSTSSSSMYVECTRRFSMCLHFFFKLSIWVSSWSKRISWAVACSYSTYKLTYQKTQHTLLDAGYKRDEIACLSRSEICCSDGREEKEVAAATILCCSSW